MLRNFIITSLRILWRNKVVSAINILSLSIGITAFILILLYVHHETSYDKFNENYERIYRLEGDGYAKLPPLIGEYIADKIPEIEKVTKLLITASRNLNYIPDDGSIAGNSIPIPVFWADSTIFDVFTFPFVQGNPKHALNEPFEIVLTESFAKKLFGRDDPIGKSVILDSRFRKNNEFKVTGILKDVHQSHVKVDAIVSRESAKISHPHRLVRANKSTDQQWWTATYILLSNKENPAMVEMKINNLLQEINTEQMIPIEFNQFHLRPLKDLYLKTMASSMLYGVQGNAFLIWSIMAVGVFVLLLAIINYINLTTARSMLRTKEIIIKKAVGSSKFLLGKQFIGESLILVLLSFLIALTLLQLSVTKFNQLGQVEIQLSHFNTLFHWILLIVGVLLLGIMAGTYPALVLTRLRSTSNILSRSKNSTQGVRLRKILLTFQFSISIVLIICVISVLRQIQYFKNSDPGFNKEHVVLIYMPRGGGDFQYINSYFTTFRERLLQNPSILKVAKCGSTLHTGTADPGVSNTQIEIDGKTSFIKLKVIDPDFLNVMDIDLEEGKSFSWDRLSDKRTYLDENTQRSYSIIVNETAAKNYWDESPVGKIYAIPARYGAVDQVKVIGVVKDVHWLSIHHKVEPIAYYWADVGRQMNIKISPIAIQETLKFIEEEWIDLYGSEPFIYSFLDEEFEAQYKNDERMASLISYFTILAIIIACMGLFGLSSFMAVRRTKEIGIRKALGASSKTIFVMLSREYFKWILLSALIASPIAWFAMNKWLETFAYRIELGPWVFILAAIIALAIGLITVGWQALKSAVANPVEALRYE